MKTEKNCLQEFARYASFNVLGMLDLSCYILADTYFISKGLGADGLTALNLAIPVYSMIHGCGLMAGMGGGTRYAIQKSLGDSGPTACLRMRSCLLAGLPYCLSLSASLVPMESQNCWVRTRLSMG